MLFLVVVVVVAWLSLAIYNIIIIRLVGIIVLAHAMFDQEFAELLILLLLLSVGH